MIRPIRPVSPGTRWGESAMEQQAAGKLGETVLAGSIVQTAGTARSMMRDGIGGAVGGTVAGVVGGMAAEALASHGGGGAELLGYRGLLYVAVGPTRVGFFRLKQGFLRDSLGDVLGILRRDAVTSVTVGSGKLTAPMTATLNDGTTLQLEVSRVHRGKAEKVAALFPPAG